MNIEKAWDIVLEIDKRYPLSKKFFEDNKDTLDELIVYKKLLKEVLFIMSNGKTL